VRGPRERPSVRGSGFEQTVARCNRKGGYNAFVSPNSHHAAHGAGTAGPGRRTAAPNPLVSCNPTSHQSVRPAFRPGMRHAPAIGRPAPNADLGGVAAALAASGQPAAPPTTTGVLTGG
jgi:hypothetical protein